MDLQMKQIRVRLGMGQKEVAEHAGMPVRRYGSYEREERTISLEDACKIADVFRCSLDELTGRWEYVGSYSDDRQRQMNEAYNRLDDGEKDSALGAVLGVASVSARKKAGSERPEANEGAA